MVQDDYIFPSTDNDVDYSLLDHAADMIAYLGPAPPEILQRGRTTGWYFTPRGIFDFDPLDFCVEIR